MNRIQTLNVVMLISGITFLYSGIKGYMPQDVLAWALGGPKPTPWAGKVGLTIGGLGGKVLKNAQPQMQQQSAPTIPTNPAAGGILSV